MERRELVLAALTPAMTGPFTPVQVQKLFFLLDDRAKKGIGGPHFDFKPHHYGPFDKEVYDELEGLAEEGLVEVVEVGRAGLRTYRLTEQGHRTGEGLLDTFDVPVREYMNEVVSFVRGKSFSELVSAIYREYPEMRENSVFGGGGE
jgi:uncharacterized protein YwgA